MKYLISLVFIFSFSLSAACLSKGMMGKSTLTVYFFDIYDIAYYKKTDSEQIKINYLRDVEKKYTIQGWEEGLQNNISDREVFKKVFDLLSSISEDVKEGDCLIISKSKNNVTISLNGKTLLTSGDKNIQKYIFTPWIGQKPVDNDLKLELLNQSS